MISPSSAWQWYDLFDAAANWGRNSIGIDVEPTYHHLALTRMQETYGLRVVYQSAMAEAVE